MLCAILYGLRISLVVGFGSVLLAALIGIALGCHGRLSWRLDRRRRS